MHQASGAVKLLNQHHTQADIDEETEETATRQQRAAWRSISCASSRSAGSVQHANASWQVFWLASSRATAFPRFRIFYFLSGTWLPLLYGDSQQRACAGLTPASLFTAFQRHHDSAKLQIIS